MGEKEVNTTAENEDKYLYIYIYDQFEKYGY